MDIPQYYSTKYKLVRLYEGLCTSDSICKSEVLLLSIIDLSPSDDSCMYSIFIYIQVKAEQMNIPT